MRTWRTIILGAALAVVAQLALVPLAETDFFFHLKLGQIILERHAIPFENLFSFTYPTHPDPDLAWGFQVLSALVFRAGGFGAIVAMKALLIVCAALLAYLVARRAGAGPLSSALAIVAAAFTAEPRMVERPHLVTFVGLGALQLLVAQRRWVLVLPLVLLWANFHAGVFLAPVWLACYTAGLWLDGRRRPRLFLLALGAAAMTFLTPAGTRLPAYLVWHTGLGSTRIIDEFRVADLWNDPWFFVCLAAIGFIAVTMRAGPRAFRLRVGWRRILPLVLVGALAWRSVRFVAEWAFLAAPVLALGLDAIARRAARVFLRGRRWRHAVAGIFVISCITCITINRRGAPSPFALADDVVPFDAIDFVTQNGLRDRLYSDLEVGCYLAWEGWPRYQVFQDARLPAYPDEMHRALDTTPLDGPAFDLLLRRYGADSALISYPGVNMRAGSFDPDEWALVYRSDEALVYARRVPRFAEVIARHEIPLRLRFRFTDGSHAELLRRPPARSPVGADEWQRRLAHLAQR